MHTSLLRKVAAYGFFLAAIPAICRAADEQVVKIGFSSPLTGMQAPAGKDNQRGVQLAIDELNKKGMVIAANKIRFELLAEDDQADPKTGVQVAQKLVDAGVKAVIGPYNSGVTIPASRIYNDAAIVTATSGSNPRITLQGLAYVYRIGASDSQLGGKMAVFAANELKLRKVAVVDDRTAYGQGVAEQFMKAAKENGLEVVGREFTNDKAVDFNAILTSIKGKRPDAIFYGGYSAQAATMAKQMRQLGISVFLLGGDAICDAEMGRLGGDAVGSKVYCSQGGSMLEAKTLGKAFSASFQKTYGSKPMTYAVSFYDAMMTIAEAMKKANSVEPRQYSPVLAAIAYQGAAGSYEFDANHDLKNSPVTVYQFKNGEPSPIFSY